MIRADEYDLVVADINMPVMDGRELLRRIKTSPRLTDLTVLVITSSYNTALVEEMKSLGASKVISKPINPVVIASVLEEISGEYKS